MPSRLSWQNWTWQRYDDFKLIRITCQAACHGKTEHGSIMMILNLSESLAKLLVMAELNMAYLSSLKKPAKLLSSYLPVSPSRILCAPGTSPYHLVPKHLRTTWSRPEQSHLLPEACSPNGTDKRWQRFCALYDNKLRYYKKKVSKLYCSYNPFNPNDSIWSQLDFRWNLMKKSGLKGLFIITVTFLPQIIFNLFTIIILRNLLLFYCIFHYFF